jgi:hypothetical protein
MIIDKGPARVEDLGLLGVLRALEDLRLGVLEDQGGI